MAAYTLTLTALIDGKTITATDTGTVGEAFEHTLELAGLASDISLTLGTITDPVYIIVIAAAEGVSFKLGAGGADDIGAYPVGMVSDTAGLSETIILLSNSAMAAISVTVLAGE